MLIGIPGVSVSGRSINSIVRFLYADTLTPCQALPIISSPDLVEITFGEIDGQHHLIVQSPVP